MGEQSAPRPHAVIVAGPNGAGKSTASESILPALGVAHFVNADVIARGLSAFRPEAVAGPAARVMLNRLRELAGARETFAFETTLAGRGHLARVRELLAAGYAIDLLFFWLPSPEAALIRVDKRVRSGGHYVPEETVRQRYVRGLENFFHLYQPLATHWRFYDNSAESGPRLVAFGDETIGIIVIDEGVWEHLVRRYGHGRASQDD